MPHIDIIGQDMRVRVLFWKVQYLFVNPAYLLEGLTGDTGISITPDPLIRHLQPEIWATLKWKILYSNSYLIYYPPGTVHLRIWEVISDKNEDKTDSTEVVTL